MSESEANGAEGSDGGEAAAVGVLDVVLLLSLVAVVIYFVVRFRRKRRERERDRRKLSISSTMLGMPVQGGEESLGGNFIDKMKYRNKKVVVFYGSQTGTAEDFASRLTKEATRHGLPGMIFDPEECTEWEDLNKLSEVENSLAIFCMATYGEGDPTDNALEFHQWLQDYNETLSGVRYTVFAVGNKTYDNYQAMGRYVDQRLAELGAERVYPAGEGDADANIEEDFVTWKEELWPSVCDRFGIDTSQQSAMAREYNLTVHSDLQPERVYSCEPHRLGSYQNQKPPHNAKNPFLAPVREHRELHRGGDRSCMHIEMDISGSRLSYMAGDHVAIFPTNNPELVERIGTLLSTDLDTVFTLTNVDDQASKQHPFPCPTTYRTALLHYVDITSCPRTNVLKELADYASDPREKEFLLKITTPSQEGKHEYSEWVLKDKRTIVAVLEDLPSFKPPLDHLLELLPRLQARYYSISSSSKMYPTSIHITAVLVEYPTRTGRTNRGVATSWLKRLTANGVPEFKVPIYVRKSSLRLPPWPNRPVIMVGPGTGLAPFRGFMQDRKITRDEGKPIGDTVLFFGCRRRNEDFLYQEELEGYESTELLKELHVAFSRDQHEKVYVQHQLLENAASIWKLINTQGCFYVCGDARNMARDVHSAILKIIQDEGGLDTEAATAYIKNMQKRNRYQLDVWS